MTKLTSQEIVDLNKEYTFFSWSVQGQVNPIAVTRAEGVYFWDADDKRYLDFSSQLMNTNIGHQHPKVIKAIQDQAAQLTFTHPPFSRLAVRKQTKTPSRLLASTRDVTRFLPAIVLITVRRMALSH